MTTRHLPALRAIVHGDHVALVPWSVTLTNAELADKPVDDGEARRFAPPRGPIVYEIWDHGTALLARPIGSDTARSRALLARWARDASRPIEVASPLPDITAAPRLAIAKETTDEPPRFRFRVEPDKRWTVAPWGFASVIEDPLANWTGAIGELREDDTDRLRVIIAATGHFTHAELRTILRGWATSDDWKLAETVTGALGAPTPTPPTHSGHSDCERCGQRLGTGFASHTAFAGRRWIPTRCDLCGIGRRRWW